MGKSFDYWQGVHEGKIKTAEKVIKYLTKRAIDLRECHKKDSCLEMAIFTEGCIEDIEEQFLPKEPIALIKGENKQDYPQALPLPPKTSENTQTSWHGF